MRRSHYISGWAVLLEVRLKEGKNRGRALVRSQTGTRIYAVGDLNREVDEAK